MRRGFRNFQLGRRSSSAGDSSSPSPRSSSEAGSGRRRIDFKELGIKARSFSLAQAAAASNAGGSATGPSPLGPRRESKALVKFTEQPMDDDGGARNASPVQLSSAQQQRSTAFDNETPRIESSVVVSSSSPASPIHGDREHATDVQSVGGRSQRSEYGGVGTDITLAEEYFGYYKGEARYVVECFVLECNRHWRHAVRDLGNKATQRFRCNEDIQKQNSLTASETRNILLGHSARVSDPWIGYLKVVRDRALQIVHRCFESAFCPRVHGPNSTIIAVGVEDAESFVDLEEMVYIHVWKSRREGRAFQHSLRALAQMRQELLLPPIVSVPFSVAVVFQCRFVTVTWMPPLVHSKPQSIEGGLLAQVEEVWRTAVGVDKPTVRVPFYAGGDGRYYSLTMDILADSNPTLTPESTLHERFEYNCRDDLIEFVRTGEGATNDAHSRNGIEDRLLPALQRKMKDIKTLLNSPPHFISHIFHNCGVNLQLMLHVRDRFAIQVNERKDQLVSLLTMGDFSRAKQYILESIDEEVVARTLKCLILGAVAHATRHYVPYSREDMSEIILRCANSTAQGFLRSGKFINQILLPAIEKKFIKAVDFVLDMDKIHLIRVFRHLEERLGLTFDVKERKFVKAELHPIFLGCTGRKPVPYCPLNDAAIVSLEFLTAQKAWRKNQRMVRRMLATLMAVSVSATGINLSIDGCFTIFTESLCDVLSRHEREQKRFLAVAPSDRMQSGSATASAGGFGNATPQAQSNMVTPFTSTIHSNMMASDNGIVPHLLLIGIMGEIVQSESPAVTASELEYLCRIKVLEFADKMYIAERCLQLFQFFNSPKGMVTVRLDDTDTRVKVLSLWGRSIMRGIENVAHQPQVDRQADPRTMYERILGKYPLPTANNLESFLSLVTQEDLMMAISRASLDVRRDIIQAFVAATIVVKNSTSERCAQVIISFADAIYDDIFEELHPTLADSLCTLHDELPRSSGMAFMIALIVAPSLMHHPNSARLAIEVGGLIRHLKIAKRIMLPTETDVFPVVSHGRVLHQTVLNIAEGRERAEDEALYKQVLDENRGGDLAMGASASMTAERSGVLDGLEDESEHYDDQTDRFSVNTAVLMAARPPGHFLMSKWLGEFLERPECQEMLERYRIELVYEQQYTVLHEFIRRNMIQDRRQQEVLQLTEMRRRHQVERELYGSYLSLSEWFLRVVVVELYEARFRCVLHEFHDRTMYRLTRHQEFQQLILVILNVVCRQKIGERVARQEAEARARREGKYLVSLLEVVEDGHREMLAHREFDERRWRLLPDHGRGLLMSDWGWRRKEELWWLSTAVFLKHFERSQKIQREALIGILVRQETFLRFRVQQRLERESAASCEGLGRWKIMQQRHMDVVVDLSEVEDRLRLMRQEELEILIAIRPTFDDIRRKELAATLATLQTHAGSWYRSQFAQWLLQRWDLHVTMRRFLDVELPESSLRVGFLVPSWTQLGARAIRDSQERILAAEAQARLQLLQAYRFFVLDASEEKSRELDIIGREREARRLRLHAYFNKLVALRRADEVASFVLTEAASRAAVERAATSSIELLLQFQVLAFAGKEDIKRQERRHFAAILAVVGIEEVAGLRQFAEEHRQTTQQRWRLVETESTLRRMFEFDERIARLAALSETHERLLLLSDEAFERQEWWYVFRDTSVLLGGGTDPLPVNSSTDYRAANTEGTANSGATQRMKSPTPPATSSSVSAFQRSTAVGRSSSGAAPLGLSRSVPTFAAVPLSATALSSAARVRSDVASASSPHFVNSMSLRNNMPTASSSSFHSSPPSHGGISRDSASPRSVVTVRTSSSAAFAAVTPPAEKRQSSPSQPAKVDTAYMTQLLSRFDSAGFWHNSRSTPSTVQHSSATARHLASSGAADAYAHY